MPKSITAKFDELIHEFNSIPKSPIEPTYLELCKYPYNRFEEICSRLLCFYFDPSKEHGFGDLFLQSLLELMPHSNGIPIISDDVRVISEDNAEGKRLDILIYSKEFVIGIENKINARLYNPLDTYKIRINQYSSENIYCVVLSLRPIVNKIEMGIMAQVGFNNITYKQLFSVAIAKIADQVTDSNNKYVLYLKDFSKTLLNMTGQDFISKELADYFHKKLDEVEQLVDFYNKFKSEISYIQKQKIKYLKELLETELGGGWWAWEGWLLGVNKFNKTGFRIGLEAAYEVLDGDALGIFKCQIVTWSSKDWSFYKDALRTKFPNCNISRDKDKWTLYLDVIKSNDEPLIMSTLTAYYAYLGELTNSPVVLKMN